MVPHEAGPQARGALFWCRQEAGDRICAAEGGRLGRVGLVVWCGQDVGDEASQTAGCAGT